MTVPKSNLVGLILSGAMAIAPLAGCGRSSPPPPVDDTANGRVGTGSLNAAPATAAKPSGMGTGEKVVLLAGAAALYYMYKHHQNAAATAQGEQGQYYLSKNGRVYYRDADHRAHWVTPPPDGLRVPQSEAAEYQQFQGYEGSASGRDLTGLADE